MATASLDIARPDPHVPPPAAAAAPARPSLAGLTRAELTARLAAIGVPERERRMRAAQLWHWIYFRGARRFEDMSNVGKGLRARSPKPTRSIVPRSSPSRSRRTAPASG